MLAYLNRLSDLLWILGRQIEVEAGVDGALRTGEAGGAKWCTRMVSRGRGGAADSALAKRGRRGGRQWSREW